MSLLQSFVQWSKKPSVALGPDPDHAIDSRGGERSVMPIEPGSRGACDDLAR